MSRGKLRTVTDACADCGALDPEWASINRGILICNECFTVHRSLGRHVSQIKSLKRGSWNPTQLAMVHTLYNNGANNIWEHTLLDPSNTKSGRRKAQPKDPIHPTKADFIRAKHQVLAFVYRPGKEDSYLADGDVSKQLHSSVRTANLETSLRLLSLGADPNYYHPEKGTCPIHVAARAGQAAQAELLIVYGADPGSLDHEGNSARDHAKQAGHVDLADRLTECMYELTDRLAYFLCSRKPDHQNGQHYIIPEMAHSLDLSDLAKAARKKLQALPNHLFEELAMDVYDEVDRRETETVWLNSPNLSALVKDRGMVPFLPVNPEFSSTRNQGRQKLARFNAREFATLIIDILLDAKRRQSGTTSMIFLSRDSEIKESSVTSSPKTQSIVKASSPLPSTTASLSSLTVSSNMSSKRRSEVSDDEPLYDSVASDEDYVSAEQQLFLARQSIAAKSRPGSIAEEAKTDASKESSPDLRKSTISGRQSTLEKSDSSSLSSSMANGPPAVEDYLKRQLAASDAQMTELQQEIRSLNNTVQKLIQENIELRGVIQRAGLRVPSPSPSPSPMPNGHDPDVALRSPRTSQRPASMYEPREGLRSQHVHRSPRSSGGRRDERLDSDGYEVPSSFLVAGRSMRSSSPSLLTPPPLPPITVTSEMVKLRTDQVTKAVQELWVAMREEKRDQLMPSADKIQTAVTNLTAIFSVTSKDETLSCILRELNVSSCQLHRECVAFTLPGQQQPIDFAVVMQTLRSHAYDLAKATKQLVTMYSC